MRAYAGGCGDENGVRVESVVFVEAVDFEGESGAVFFLWEVGVDGRGPGGRGNQV